MKQKFCEKFPDKSCQQASSSGTSGEHRFQHSCHDDKICINMVDDNVEVQESVFTGQQC
jgi:hypothetical protein